MKTNKLSPEEEKIEFEKCKNSTAYFYNNYCRKDGEPEYTEEVFEKYQNTVKIMRQSQRLGDHKMKLWLSQFPLTEKEAFKGNF